jgi:eukaryotic-like serine/threonine-protein kinase
MHILDPPAGSPIPAAVGYPRRPLFRTSSRVAMTSGQAISASARGAASPPPVRRRTTLPAGESVPAGERLPTIGQWRLTRLVGAGQWTRVYRARPLNAAESDGGDFAVKILADELAHDPLARALLRREAHISRQVQHSQLATVLADQSASEPPHLVLPYLPGVSLRQIVDRCGMPQALPRDLPTATALLYVRQIAEALAALHGAGWLHGDVKPENVLVGPSGHATLLDLGLARQLGSESCSARYVLATTLAYAAPESFSEGEWLSGAADIYSLGILLWELLNGQPPFVADPVELVDLHRRQSPPDLRTLRHDATQELAGLLRLMLAKEPLRRPEAPRLVRLLVEQEILALAGRTVAS